MNMIRKLTMSAVAWLLASTAFAQQQVPMWERFEQCYNCHTEKNPFTDVTLTAIFRHETSGETVKVDGFYDGDDTYRLRFMPTKKGKWTFTTRSSEKEMNMQEGSLLCTDAVTKGMVQASGQSFVYPDGTLYHPVGTTSYAWIHSTKERQEQTYQSLQKAAFNKLRFCVFPNNSVNELPEIYPFKLVSSKKDAEGKTHYVWDYTRFDVKFFQHLDEVVDRLRTLGIEADLILFTPYDGGFWGFDRMTMENNNRYLRYIVARLASFSNIWRRCGNGKKHYP